MRISLFSPTYRVKYLSVSLFVHFRLLPLFILRLTSSFPHEAIPRHLMYSFPPAAAPTVSNEHQSPWDPHVLWSIMANGISERHRGFLPWKVYSTTYSGIMTFIKKKKKKPDRIWGTSVCMNTLRIRGLSMRTHNTEQTKGQALRAQKKKWDLKGNIFQ